MFLTREEQSCFLAQFNISEEQFRESMLTWDELDKIANNFEKTKDEHQSTVRKYAEVFQQCSDVHSLGYRVKETNHLIEKIIRKNSKFLKQGSAISLRNYSECITDLIGIRILLLFKEDWIGVHKFIMEKYEKHLAEEPFAYIRLGDSPLLYEGKVRIVEEKPYRSVHYLIKDNDGIYVEVQVRTLFEEAWSEIDHKLRYPYKLSNEMINAYLSIMNRSAGMADEMGTFINSYIKNFENAMSKGVINENEVYDYILNEIKLCKDEEIKKSWMDLIEHYNQMKKDTIIKLIFQIQINKISNSQKYREMKKMSDLISDLMKNI